MKNSPKNKKLPLHQKRQNLSKPLPKKIIKKIQPKRRRRKRIKRIRIKLLLIPSKILMILLLPVTFFYFPLSHISIDVEKTLGQSQQEIKDVDEKQKTPSNEAQDELSNEGEIKISSKTAKNKKKKSKKKNKKNASSIPALDDEDKKTKLKGEESNKNPNLKGRGTPDSDLSQVSEVEEEISFHESRKRALREKTLRETQEDPTLISQGFLFIPNSCFYDDLIKSMKFVN